MESVNLVAVGSGGWVRFWNTNGYGLAAEFCVFDYHRRTKFLNKDNESVTSCAVTYANDLLFTGDSLGYIMVRNIYMQYIIIIIYHRYGIYLHTVSTRLVILLLFMHRH